MTGPEGHWFAAPERVWPSGLEATCDGRAVTFLRDAGRIGLHCEGRQIVIVGD